jgi:hypothetical protein
MGGAPSRSAWLRCAISNPLWVGCWFSDVTQTAGRVDSPWWRDVPRRYCIGDHVYSMNDLENGIIRGNKVPPYHLRKPFSAKDPRAAVALPRGEWRIHAALNCGAKSCPPIKFFTPEAVREELRIAAMAFGEMEENVRFDTEKRTLWLTAICSWYSSDFGGGKREIATTIASILRGEKKALLETWLSEGDDKKLGFKIRHMPYDWSTNASRAKEYSPGDGKTTTSHSCTIV